MLSSSDVWVLTGFGSRYLCPWPVQISVRALTLRAQGADPPCTAWGDDGQGCDASRPQSLAPRATEVLALHLGASLLFDQSVYISKACNLHP